jgi:deoxyribodipyrimidine photo-lyase
MIAFPMPTRHTVPANRVRSVNDRPVRADGELVVYWMTAFRRTRSNFALQRARDWARQLQKPLLILEGLRTRYRWASERLHRFVIEGMQDNAAACSAAGVAYHPFVEPRAGQGSGLMEALARRACILVTDDFPCFFHPEMIALAGRTLPVALEAVDSNGLMPLAVPDRTFTVAHSYRRFMQKELPKYLEAAPDPNPLTKTATQHLPPLRELPAELQQRWPAAPLEQLLAEGGLSNLPIDHSVRPVADRGGSVVAGQLLRVFLRQHLDAYHEERNHPDRQATSQLSAYLHFGHISAHEVFGALMQSVGWTPAQLGKPNGKMDGYWNAGAAAEAFLDQLCTWREIGFNMCWRERNYDHYDSLPEWALQTLEEHAGDPRPRIYSLEELEQARTYDPIWNASQRQLVREGRIHNYLRMLWGKKILEWTPHPREALRIMIHLNNKYALDGRNPNSYSGIFWVLGRYDRAWGPERPIFGKIRYMTSDSAARKIRLKEYLREYSEFPLFSSNAGR